MPESFTSGLVTNLVAGLIILVVLDVPVTILIVDRFLKRRSRQQSQRAWAVVRQYFRDELGRGIDDLLQQLNWPGQKKEHGPNDVAELILKRSEESEESLVDFDPERTRKYVLPFTRLVSDAEVLSAVQRLRERLRELAFANLPDAFSNRVVSNAWAAYGTLSAWVDPKRGIFPCDILTHPFQRHPADDILDVNIAARKFADSVKTLEPLWRWTSSGDE